MVDWESGGSVPQAEKMQAEVESRRPRPPHGMLEEDEPELNAMDFVEIEYKPNQIPDKDIDYKPNQIPVKKGGRKSRQKKIRSTIKNTKVDNACSLQDVPVTKEKLARKRRKPRTRERKSRLLPTQKLSMSDFSMLYPYAACLKTLCDKAGHVQSSEPDVLPERIFDTLRTTSVHYPYASLLEELHQNAEAGTSSTSTPSTTNSLPHHDIRDLEVADIMRNLHYPVRSTSYSRNYGNARLDTFATPFSGMLMAMVMRHRIDNYTKNPQNELKTKAALDCGRVGEILKTQMPLIEELNHPPEEMHTSALLQKLALSAQQKQNVTHESECASGREVMLEWSSAESSQSEEEDLEWQPTYWLAKKVRSNDDTPRKRKSRRRKKESAAGEKRGIPLTEDITATNYKTIPQDCIPEVVPKNANSHKSIKCKPVCTSSPRPPSRLLQLIMGCEQSDVGEKRKKKQSMKRTKLGRRKGKRKVTKDPNDSEDLVSDVPDKRGQCKLPKEKKVQEDTATVMTGSVESNKASEPQSLLKEYLLKPTGGEVVSSENCEIPKVETNFLFSRLLQNFKNLAETNRPETLADSGREVGGSQSILRGMLAAGSNSATELLGKTVKEEQVDEIIFTESFGASPSNHQYPRSPLYGEDSPMCKVKCEPEIKVECEEVFCKVECEEEVFECQVCFLQFSSGIDLSNHQVLFHCTEEPSDSGGRQLVPCGVEGLQGGGVLHA